MTESDGEYNNVPLDALIDKQEDHAIKIKAIFDNLKKRAKPERTQGYLRVKLREIQINIKEFKETHNMIFNRVPRAQRLKHPYLSSNIFSETYDAAVLMEIKIEEWNDELFNVQPTPINLPDNNTGVIEHQTQSRPDKIRLEPVKLEIFTGDYHKWTTFKCLFVNLIHDNKDIKPIEKFHHLMASLAGDAKRLVSHYNITTENYHSAWDTLINRYENKRVLINTELKMLLTQQQISHESANNIREILDKSQECLNSIKNLGIDISTWDPIIIYILVQKLDSESHRHWENSLANPKDIPKFSDFVSFLENRFHVLQNLSQPKQKPAASTSSSSYNNTTRNSNYSSNNQRMSEYNKPKPQFSNQYKATNSSNNQPSSSKTQRTFFTKINPRCPICATEHSIFNCSHFNTASCEQKYAMIREKQLCINCLGEHNAMTCGSSKRCKICQLRHHTLLHNNINEPQVQSNNQTVHLNGGQYQPTPTLLATALVNVFAYNGVQYTFRCLLDQGSTASFITERASQLLRLPRNPVVAQITALSSNKAETAKSIVTFNIMPTHNNSFNLKIQALVLKTITTNIPSTKIFNKNWQHINGLQLADPEYSHPNKIDILLGADVYSQILLDGLVRGPPGTPIAQNSHLGWILSGSTSKQQSFHQSRTVVSFHIRTDIDTQLKKFWELEEVSKNRILTKEDIQCEHIFQQTHRRDTTGRYVVALPFKNNIQPLGQSKGQAFSRFMQLEKRFAKNQTFQQSYKDVIKEYSNLNHMTKISPSTKNSTSYYLPHHAVVKNSSTTTKLRVVFDASAKTTTGESLNDQLLTGPTLQQDLFTIILKWRMHNVILCADIAKMYRQIRVRTEDQKFQKILWREEHYQQLQEFQLNTVTFGTAPAAYLAIRSLQQLAYDYTSKYPVASDKVLNDFYVDDLLTGADTIEQTINLQKELTNLLAEGGFELRKWISNKIEALQAIPKHLQETSLPISLDMENTTKTLGIFYHPAADHFTFKINVNTSNQQPTKRNLLSDTARLFDPLGLLAPVTIKAKIMFQHLWKEGYEWDDILENEVKNDWLKFRNELHTLEKLKIPRWLGKNDSSQIQLHGFCDASEKAYAAVVYIRTINRNKQITSTLVASKTKVAPLKQVSLPRLELCGAELLTKLLTHVQHALKVKCEDIFAWTDSTITLAWIKGSPTRWKTFVANRVVKIQENIKPSQWRHVPSEHNPADIASRGIFPSDLENQKIWWAGPRWLYDATDKWKLCTNEIKCETSQEAKKNEIQCLHIQDNEPSLLDRYSSLTKLLRVIATIRRFSFNCRHPEKKTTGPLSTKEIIEAKNVCTTIAQNREFHQEIYQLRNKRPLNKRSKIISFNPFLDENNNIRIGGRIGNANIPFNQKHQLLLPQKTNFTKLLIKDAHIRTQHSGAQLTTMVLRKHFWILGCRNAVKRVIHECIVCHRYRKSPNEQIMGSLPESRVTPCRPFTNVGVDYAGPIDVKSSNLRNAKILKGYIALFICLSTKAIHIELVSELNTPAFLAAFNRFVGRRGLPSNIFSDNAKNFIGADRALNKQFQNLTDFNYIANVLANQQIQWNFIPPRSPHFGGLWEAGIKAMKSRLIKVIKNTTLSFEDLNTVLIQIEATLNSRPLMALSEDPNDLSALTPGHFLIGSELIAPPSENFVQRNIQQLSKWRKLNKLHQDFWKIWKDYYLNTLQQRNKWQIVKQESKEGSMVVLKEDNMPPSKWALGRITQVHPGKDGHVRVVTVRTATGEYVRNINKICPLPMADI